MNELPKVMHSNEIAFLAAKHCIKSLKYELFSGDPEDIEQSLQDVVESVQYCIKLRKEYLRQKSSGLPSFLSRSRDDSSS